MDEVFFQKAKASVTPVDPGRVERRVLARGGSLMMVEVSFMKDAVGALHSHPHEQITYCAAGVFDFTVGERTERLNQGDTVYIPSGAAHSTVCLQTGVLVDVFSPQREDFLY